MLTSFCNDIYDMLCQKHPNSNIYVIGDEHFYHANIINYTRKEFSDIEQMHKTIINSHNAVVGPNDIVIIVGDFSFKKAYIKDILAKLNGHKYLILGNHDYPDLSKNYPDLGFEGVYCSPIKINGDYFSHEPLLIEENSSLQFQLVAREFAKNAGSKNYHGHAHVVTNLDEKFVNTACEIVDYKPLFVGRTIESVDKDHLFINSPFFCDSLAFLEHTNGIDARILIADYLYASMLQSVSWAKDEFFIQGSYGLFKKYGFISLFSDLDISLFYHDDKTRRKNEELLKAFVDSAYEDLKNINGIDLFFYKRYASLRMFQALYTSLNPFFVRSVMDANLILLDSYKDSDFITLNRTTMMQRLLCKNGIDYADGYNFPEFSAKYLSAEGDIANLVLQLLFQQGRENEQKMAYRKLHYVYKKRFTEEEMQDFANLFSRFFLRNVALLHSLHRYGEIEAMASSLDNISDFLKALPVSLAYQLYEILQKNESEFLDIFREVALTPPSDVIQVCQTRTRKLK